MPTTPVELPPSLVARVILNLQVDRLLVSLQIAPARESFAALSAFRRVADLLRGRRLRVDRHHVLLAVLEPANIFELSYLMSRETHQLTFNSLIRCLVPSFVWQYVVLVISPNRSPCT